MRASGRYRIHVPTAELARDFAGGGACVNLARPTLVRVGGFLVPSSLRSVTDESILHSAAGAAVLILDGDLRIECASSEASRYLGIGSSDVGRAITEFSTQSETAGLVEDARRAIADGVSVVREVCRPDGKPFVACAMPLSSQDGKKISVAVTCVDLEPWRHLESRLRDEVAFAESIIDAFYDPLLVLRADLHVDWANPAYLQHFCVRSGEVEGHSVYAIGKGQWDTPELRRLLQDILPGSEATVEYEAAYQFDDFGLRFIRLMARRTADRRYIMLGIRDISDPRAAEDALRASEKRFRAVVELVPDLLWSSDPQGHATWHNSRWLDYTGQAPEEAAGYGWACAIHPDDRERSLADFEEALTTNDPLEQELRIRGRDGSYRWFLLRAEAVRDEDGNVLHLFGTATDVHEQRTMLDSLEKRVEERTREVEELASKLTTAEQRERRRIGQILHDDLQQLLYGVEVKMDVVRRGLDRMERQEVEDNLMEARSWIRRAIATTRQLSVDMSPPILPNEGLTDSLEWLKTQMKELHELDVALEAEHSWRIDDANIRVLLFQTVRELLFNVKKHAHVKHASVQLIEEAGGLVIHVIDRGAGFEPEKLDNRSEVGLGLLSARERLRLLGGRLEISARPGDGTHVRVYAPTGTG